MAMHFAETSRESIEEFWRAIRHCDKNPSCRVIPGVAANNFYPAVQPMRDLSGGEELTVNFRTVSRAALDGFPWIAAIISDKVATYDKAKMETLGPLIEANEHLYHANKKLSAENATSEAKLTHMKSTINALVSKIGTQTGETMQSSSGDAKRSEAALIAPSTSEVTMLTEQLKKLNLSNERLSNELVDLKKQHFALRNQKKEAAGQKKH